MRRRIHNDKSLGPCRVLWARAKANHLPDPQEQQVNLILKNGSGSHTRQIWTSSLRRVYYPFWGSENPWPTALLRNKATFWDGEGTLQAEQDCVHHQECHLLCAQAARGSNSSSNNKAVMLEPDRFSVPHRPSFPNTNRCPSPWPESAPATNIWVSHTTNCSLLPLSCNKEN